MTDPAFQALLDRVHAADTELAVKLKYLATIADDSLVICDIDNLGPVVRSVINRMNIELADRHDSGQPFVCAHLDEAPDQTGVRYGNANGLWGCVYCMSTVPMPDHCDHCDGPMADGERVAHVTHQPTHTFRSIGQGPPTLVVVTLCLDCTLTNNDT